MAPNKRKRTTDSAPGRPAPHRPADTNLGQHERGRAGNNSGRSTRRNDRRESGPSTTAPGPASPLNSPTVPRPPSSSSQPAVAPSNAKPIITPSSAPLTPIKSGYHYDIITDARLGNWAQIGRQELIDHGIQSRNDEDGQELCTIFQELIQSCLDFRLKGSQAGDVAKEVLGTRPEDADSNIRAFDPHTLFLDTVSIYLDTESGSYKSCLYDLMLATDIDPGLMRRVLEPPVLEQLGLIRETFARMGIRQATNILYKQANYNLLREETEGYAKLATELFATCNSQAPTSEVIRTAFERVKGLIGTFDLDVGRVLDVLLDIFANVLIKQFRFFVRFLRISSWWPQSHSKSSAFIGGLPKWAFPDSENWLTTEEDEIILSEQRLQRDIQFWDRAREVQLNAYFELGGRQLQGQELGRVNAILAANGESLEDLSVLDSDEQWIVATKTMPPQGNRVAAQLLGFKLRFYESEWRDKDTDILPANLLYLAALLIKIGFISLADLWPHVGPFTDEEMEKYREKKMKEHADEERKKTGGGANALTMSVLPSDENDSQRTAKINAELKAASSNNTVDKKKEADDHCQKAKLLTELLTLGAIPEALFILSRYPWLPEAYPEHIKLINRLISYSIEKVYEQTKFKRQDLEAPKETPSKRLPDIDQTGAVKGSVRLGQTQIRRPLRWPFPDGENLNAIYRFYWDEWADNVPICQSIEDVFTLCGTLMNLSGVNIGKDPALLSKLAGIGAMSLAQDQSQENMNRWQDLLIRLLVPALSLTEANSYAVQAVWDLLKLFPITTRYGIYSEWFLGRTSRNPAIRSAFARTRSETNSVLKRLSLQNLTAMAKKLAKTAYSSPGIVFKTAFDQIEAYPNLIQAFVECARYFTELGYDVLTWSLMSALGGKSRSRTQEASVLLTSKWLQALSKFSGRVFKRYQNMTPAPVLQYVNSQLFKSNSTDLVILRELISTMAGVVPDVDFTDAQLRAMTGGEVLRRQTLIKLGDRRFESVNGAKRLMQSLVDTKLAGKLLINLAQYRQSSVYQDNAHVKYLATIMDEVQLALSQYLDLLRSNLPPDQFDTLIPGIAELMTAYGLDVNLAFMIGRASLAYQMANTKATPSAVAKDGRSDTLPTPDAADADGDLSMNGNAGTNEQSPAKDEAEDKMVLDDKPLKDSTPETGSSTIETRNPDPMTNVLQPLVDTMQDMLPSETWEKISPEFYVTFWSLSLGDLHVPQSSYESEHDRLYKESEDVMKDRSDMTRQGMNKKDEKKKALQALAKSIREEMSSHINRYQKTKFRLARQAKSWFSGPVADANAIADDLLEHCILPRLFVSALDTEYCFRLVKFLHENQTPNFKLFALYEQFFNANRLRAMIFSATVREAEHLARFIKCILEDLAKWHADKNVYEKEAFGLRRKYLGFATAFDDEGSPTAFVEHPNFRDSYYEWHKNLNMALKACLQGTKEWMHIRNALTVVRWVSEFFPAVNFMGTQLLKVLDDIKTREDGSKGGSEEEHRVDLAVTAQTVYSMLKKRESKWVPVQAFRPNMSGMPLDIPKDVEMTTSTPGSNLRATAPEFKPPPSTSASATAAPGEEEDGEVKDGKDAKSSVIPAKPDLPKAESITSKPADQEKVAAKENAAKDKPPAQNSRPATPKPIVAIPVNPSASTGRREEPRATSVSSRPERLPHGLPNRPDVPIGGHFRRQQQPNVEERRDSSRDARESKQPRDRESRDRRDPREAPRDTREPRDHRQQDPSRGEKREHHDADRRGNESAARDPARPSEREWTNRPESGPRRAESTNDREARSGRDRASNSGRDSRGRDNSNSAPQNQVPGSQTPAEEPPMNPARAALLQVDDRADMINPARAALIQTSQGHVSTRSPRDGGRDRTSSRTSSPRRDDRHNNNVPVGTHPREDRHGRRGAQTSEAPQASARENDHSRDQDRPSGDRNRETDHTGPLSRPHDSERGRGNQNQQDPNYGRLNPIPTIPADTPPQGPRGRGARNTTRLSSAPTAPRSDGRMGPPEVNRPPSPDRQPPTGPSSSRGRRPQQSQFDQANPANTTTSVPTGGMHPDRMKQFESSSQQVPVHPDRMNLVAPLPPPPPPGPPSRTRPNMPPVHTGDRVSTPTGPSNSRQGHASLPSTPVSEHNGTQGFSAPTGPSGGHDRQRGSARRHLENLQNIITPNRRDGDYRRQRASMPDSDAQILTGASPVSTPVHERPDPIRRNQLPERLAPGNDNAGPPPPDPRPGPNGEDTPNSRGDHDRSGRRDHRDRSDRPSRHGGRDRSPRGDRDAREPRGGDGHERHDRRSGVPPGTDATRDRDPNHEPIQPRRSMRDLAANNNSRELVQNGGREQPSSGREPRHRGDARGEGRGENTRGDGGNRGRPGEDWAASSRGGSMRGPRDGPRDGAREGIPGRMGDDRRDNRGDDRNSSRKRRSDVAEMPPNDRDKRMRR